jgi:hypothetical protein
MLLLIKLLLIKLDQKPKKAAVQGIQHRPYARSHWGAKSHYQPEGG